MDPPGIGTDEKGTFIDASIFFLPNGLRDKSKKSKLIHFDHLNHEKKRAGVID